MPNTIVKAPQLRQIFYCDKPLPQARRDEITSLTTEQLSAMFGIKYTESTIADSDTEKQLNNPDVQQALKAEQDEQYKLYGTKYEQLKAQTKEYLKNPCNKFAICKMNDKVGYGLFATEDIESGTVLFLYSGKITSSSNITLDEAPSVAEDRYKYSLLVTQDTVFHISAKDTGGLARFMQHLPADLERHKKSQKALAKQHYSKEYLESAGLSEEYFESKLEEMAEESAQIAANNGYGRELANTEFSPGVRENLATSNTTLNFVLLDDNTPVIVCSAEFPIQKNEQIGFDYGISYQLDPYFFYKNGEIVPPELYTKKIPQGLTAHSFEPSATPSSSETSFTQLSGLNNLFSSASNQTSAQDLYKRSIKDFKQCHYAKAISTLNQALSKLEASNSFSKLQGQCYSTLASCHRDNGNLTQAYSYAEQAVNILEQVDNATDSLNKARQKKQGIEDTMSPSTSFGPT